MSNFDDLLDEALREDGDQQPPDGLEERLLASLPSAGTRTRTFSAVLTRVAAVLAIGAFGVATWTFVGVRGGQMFATYSVTRGLEPGAAPSSAALRGSPGPRFNRSFEQKTSSQELTRAGTPSRQPPIVVAPVVIGPLTINPIDIASISLDDLAKKGSTK